MNSTSKERHYEAVLKQHVQQVYDRYPTPYSKFKTNNPVAFTCLQTAASEIAQTHLLKEIAYGSFNVLLKKLWTNIRQWKKRQLKRKQNIRFMNWDHYSREERKMLGASIERTGFTALFKHKPPLRDKEDQEVPFHCCWGPPQPPKQSQVHRNPDDEVQWGVLKIAKSKYHGWDTEMVWYYDVESIAARGLTKNNLNEDDKDVELCSMAAVLNWITNGGTLLLDSRTEKILQKSTKDRLAWEAGMKAWAAGRLGYGYNGNTDDIYVQRIRDDKREENRWIEEVCYHGMRGNFGCTNPGTCAVPS
jgi:hypothetical protein